MQSCDQTCSWCARDWWRWLKSREAQMSVPRKRKGVRPAEVTTFTTAAATSVRPPWPLGPCTCSFPVGTRVTYRDRPFVVVHNAGYVGLDGRHWIGVECDEDAWSVHVRCTDLQYR